MNNVLIRNVSSLQIYYKKWKIILDFCGQPNEFSKDKAIDIIIWIVTFFIFKQKRSTLFSFVAHVNGLAQDCYNSSALAMELLQSCTKPLMCNVVILQPISIHSCVVLSTKTVTYLAPGAITWVSYFMYRVYIL